MYDVVVIGGGPGGITAAMYCVRSNLKTLLIEKEFLGGYVSYAGVIENYPGFPEGIKGFELGQKMGEQAQKAGVEIVYESVERIDTEAMVVVTGEREIPTKAIVLSPGLRHKELEVPGEEAFKGKGVVYCTTCDAPLYAGKKTVVAGKGIPGITASLYLDEIAESVTLVTPTKELKAKETIYLDKIRDSGVRVIANAEVKELRGGAYLEKVVIADKSTGEETVLDADGIFVNIGKVPNTAFLADSGIELDKKGFIVVDSTQMTTKHLVFAVGDATTDPYKQISTAVGDGAKAALTIAKLIK